MVQLKHIFLGLFPLVFCGFFSLAGCQEVSSIEPYESLSNHVDDWRDEVIYQVFVDRFANGDTNNDFNVNPLSPAQYHGGDWQGLIDRLDYIESLGVTALWISPVVKNLETDAGVDSYHGYWTQDFLSTNPHFGDLAKLRELVDACHARGIKVILDVVVNHIGQLFYYDINGNGEPNEAVFGDGENSDITHISEYDPDFNPIGIQAKTSLGLAGTAPIRWFHVPEINRVPPLPEEFQNPEWYNRKGRVNDWNDPEQVLLGDFPGGLKDIKTTDPDVRDALFKVFSHWIEVADFDAFRIDTIKHVEHEFWEDFCPRIRAFAKKKGKKNFFMFGEAFDGNDELIGSYTFNGGLDSVFYFSHKYRVIDNVFKYGGATSAITAIREEQAAHYDPEPHEDGPIDEDGNGVSARQLLVHFLDNHDVARFLFDLPSIKALENALFYLLTTDGIPCIYYGTEQQFAGGNDPFNREDLWVSGYKETNSTFKLIQKLTGLRKSLAPLRRGEMTIRYSTDHTGEEEDAGIFAFERTYKGETVLVVFNTHNESSNKTGSGENAMETSFSEGDTLKDIFGGELTITVEAAGHVSITVPPRTGMIFVLEEGGSD